MISKIPTPNTKVDTSLWPVVKVTLGRGPSEDECRVTLGRLRALRTHNSPHFVVIDARKLAEVPSRYVEMRLCTFVFESAELGQGGAVGVAVISNNPLVDNAVASLQRSCNRLGHRVIVKDLAEALEMAGSALPGTGSSLFETLTGRNS